jgi:hypothetical protein
MFEPREVEGDKETGDTRDAGEDPRFRAIERNVADGREDDARLQRTRQQQPDPENEFGDEPPEQIGDLEPGENDGSEQNVVEDDDDGQKYEVTVDGKPREVSLKEALAGYIRQETFHERMTTLMEVQKNMEADATRLQTGWQLIIKGMKEYEADLKDMIPPEPDWNRLLKENPALYQQQREIYQTLYNRRSEQIARRQENEAQAAQQEQERLKMYAINGQNEFYRRNAKTFTSKEIYDKNIQSMRRTAMAEGFTEAEVATVFDPRMLTILLKASKYDRMQAASVRAVDPSKGKSITPGSATPLRRNATRKGRDEAASRLQKEGSIDAAADYFRSVL